jgi:hypothetical protein
MSSLGLITVTLSVFAIFGLFGAWIGKRSGRGEAGFLWGFILGPFGWLAPLAWLWTTGRRQS